MNLEKNLYGLFKIIQERNGSHKNSNTRNDKCEEEIKTINNK